MGSRASGGGPRPAMVAAAGLLSLAVAMGIGRFAFTPILPLMQQDLGLSVAEGGWLASANYLGYLAGALAVSAAATRIRPATGIRGGLAVIVVATLGMGLEGRFAVWLLLRAVAGVASAAVLIFASAWCLDRLAAAGRPALSGVVFAGVGTGIVVAGVLCLVWASLGAGSTQAWIGLGVVSAAGTAVTWRVFGAGDRAPGVAGGPHPAPGGRWLPAGSMRLVLCYGAFGFGYIVPATFLPAMAREAVPDPLVFGWSWPVFGVAAAASTLGAAASARLIATRHLWMSGHLVMAVGVALPVWRPGIGSILIAALLVGGTFVVITQAGLQEARAAGGPRGTRLMAAMTAAFAAGQVAGPVLVSYLVGPLADFSRPLLAAAFALLVSGFALLRPSPSAGAPPRPR